MNRKLLAISLLCILLIRCSLVDNGNIVLENNYLKYVITKNGKNLHFIDNLTGIDYLQKDSTSHCAYIIQEDHIHYADFVLLRENKLFIEFEKCDVKAEIEIKRNDEYILFEVNAIDGQIKSFTFLNIPLILKGMSDEQYATCALALNQNTHVRQLPVLQTHLWATTYEHFGIKGAKVAVLGLPMDSILHSIRNIMESTKALPHSRAGGAWATENKEGYGSYLMNFGSLTEKTVDEWISMCKNWGFNQIDNHGGGFFNFGELKIDSIRFPGGWNDFCKINSRLNNAGISSILHTYAYFIDKKSKYVTPSVHPDLGYFDSFTLAQPVSEEDSVIVVNESTADISTTIGFFVRNSVSLRIGEELIEFTGVSKTPPYKFTGCKRGMHGTKKSPYKANEEAFHLKEVYGRFIPGPETQLFKQIAKRTAEVVNKGGFNGIYLDAVDGGDVLRGGENFWYYPSQFIFEIARHLEKPVGMEMASMSHFWWHYRSRWQAWDSPFRGYKRFIDIHLAAIKSPNEFLTGTIKSNDFEHGVWRGDTALINKYAALKNGALMLPFTLGWWANNIGQSPQTETTFPDDIEYLACKMIGNDAGIAILGGFDDGTLEAIPLFKRSSSIIKQYERLRHSNYFNDSVKTMLRQPGKEFKLFQDDKGRWNFRPAIYQKHKISGGSNPSMKWTVNNEFKSQPVKLRIEALMSVNSYDNHDNNVVSGFRNTKFSNGESAAGVSGGIKDTQEKTPDGGKSIIFYANSTGNSPERASWISMEKKIEPVLNIEKKQALGVWIKGDSSGALLNLRLESPKYISHGARGDHFVKLNFIGWQYFELVEIESSEFTNYIWPNSDFYVYDSYRHTIDFKNINKFQFWYNNLPKGKKVKCAIGKVKALELVSNTIENPSVSINGEKVVFPVSMQSGMYLEFWPPDNCKLFSKKGKLLQEVSIEGKIPELKHGDNEIYFDCNVLKPQNPRLQITVINQGNSIINY
jgi:hypothetical protein